MSKKLSGKKSLNFTSLGELNKISEDIKIKIDNMYQCKQYCKAANDIFRKADNMYKTKDEEQAYMLFMRYFHITSTIKKSYEFSKSKNTYVTILKECSAGAAMQKAEELSESLRSRYEKRAKEIKEREELEERKREMEKVKSKDVDDLILPDVPSDSGETSKASTPNLTVPETESAGEGVAGKKNGAEIYPTKEWISVTGFYALLKDHKNNLEDIMIIDVRPPNEYDASRINHRCSINVPEYLLQTGANINSIERKLNKSTWEIWASRFVKKFLVLLTYETDNEEVTTHSPLLLLQDVLCKFGGSYKLFLLTGGFRQWILHYPQLTTNPYYTKQPTMPTFLGSADLLKNLTYPELPTTVKKDPVAEKKEPGPGNIIPAGGLQQFNSKDGRMLSNIVNPNANPSTAGSNIPITDKMKDMNLASKKQEFHFSEVDMKDRGSNNVPLPPTTGPLPNMKPLSRNDGVVVQLPPGSLPNPGPNGNIDNADTHIQLHTNRMPVNPRLSAVGPATPIVSTPTPVVTPVPSTVPSSDPLYKPNSSHTTSTSNPMKVLQNPSVPVNATSNNSDKSSIASEPSKLIPDTDSTNITVHAGPPEAKSGVPDIHPASAVGPGVASTGCQQTTMMQPQQPQVPTSPPLLQPKQLPISPQQPHEHSQPQQPQKTQKIEHPEQQKQPQVSQQLPPQLLQPKHPEEQPPPQQPQVSQLPQQFQSPLSSQQAQKPHSQPQQPHQLQQPQPLPPKPQPQQPVPQQTQQPQSQPQPLSPPQPQPQPQQPQPQPQPQPQQPQQPKQQQPQPQQPLPKQTQPQQPSLQPQLPQPQQPPQPLQQPLQPQQQKPQLPPLQPALQPPLSQPKHPQLQGEQPQSLPLPQQQTQIQQPIPKSVKLTTTFGLPYGWEKAVSHETGRIYYKDHNTHKTYWTLPPEIVAQVHQNETRAPVEPATVGHNIAPTGVAAPHSEVKKSKLKRTLSSPNIADLINNNSNNNNNNNNNNELNITDKTVPRPVIDRSVKPKDERPVLVDRTKKPISASRLSNLSPVYGSQGYALTGLKNLGNTCYMNSVVQCLSNTEPLKRYFTSGCHERDLNTRNMNSHPGEIAREISFLVIVLSAGQYRSVSPVDFKLALGRFSSQFANSQQQDSHELLMFLLDGLHEDVNKVRTRQAIKERNDDNLPDDVAANHAWSDYLLNNNSVIVDLFQGQFRSTVVCLSCGEKSKTFDAFNCLQLELPANKSSTLENCITSFSKPEKIGGNNSWKCSKCKCYREAAKTIEVWKLPPVLIILLKRFRFDGRWRNKIQSTINFPLNNFNMGKYVVSSIATPASYRLYGVINHYGSFESGHYTAFCENAATGRWHCFDDNIVKDLDTGSVRTSAAYLLFYTHMSFKE